MGLTALHMLRRARFQAGELLGIIGLGLVGQLEAQLAHALGGRAVGSDLLPLRLEKARQGGIEAAVDARPPAIWCRRCAGASGGAGADHVCICVVGGTRELTPTAVRAVRPSGVLLLVGGYQADFSGGAGDADPHTKEIDVRFVYGRGPGGTAIRAGTCAGGSTDASCAGRRAPTWRRSSTCRPADGCAPRAAADPPLSVKLPQAADLLIEHPEQALGVVLTYGA